MKNPFIVRAQAAALLHARMVKFRRRTLSTPSPKLTGNKTGKYSPHQSKRECARRVRQIQMGLLKAS